MCRATARNELSACTAGTVHRSAGAARVPAVNIASASTHFRSESAQVPISTSRPTVRLGFFDLAIGQCVVGAVESGYLASPMAIRRSS